jgi:hypothetical protein
MVLCLLVGLLCAGTSGYRFLQRVMLADHRKTLEKEKETAEKTVVYYSHE